MKSTLLICALSLLATTPAFAVGKDPLHTRLSCTAELPADDNGNSQTASLDVDAVNSRRQVTSLILHHPGAEVGLVGGSDSQLKVNAVVTNQINQLSEVKILMIDPSIEDLKDDNGVVTKKAENRNVVFKLKVKYKEDPTTHAVSYIGSIFYTLNVADNNLLASGSASCTCADATTGKPVDCETKQKTK